MIGAKLDSPASKPGIAVQLILLLKLPYIYEKFISVPLSYLANCPLKSSVDNFKNICKYI